MFKNKPKQCCIIVFCKLIQLFIRFIYMWNHKCFSLNEVEGFRTVLKLVDNSD